MMTRKIERLSVVMTVHNEAKEVEEELPHFLTQQCQRAYEVIVVDDASTDETPDILKRLKAQYPLLYTTFIPCSVPNPSRNRLALTIGAKAAKGDWVVLADVKRPPVTDDALETMAQIAEEGQDDVVMMYNPRKADDAPRYQSWTMLSDAAPLLLKAERRMGKGHRGRFLKYRRGLYDAIAVPRQHIHETLKHYDHPVRGFRLMGLRLSVWWKTLWN